MMIIHDLETVYTRDFKLVSEIIDLAALKVAVENGSLKIIDSFHSYVKPSFLSKLPIATTNFTGITHKDVSSADNFPGVLKSFRSWIGTDNYYLCSWSLSDRDIFAYECRNHRLETKWLKNYNDIQEWYCKVRKLERRINLKKALEVEGMGWQGSQHNANDDTINTFRLLEKIYEPQNPIFTLKSNELLEGVQTEVVYSDIGFINNPFEKLRAMMG